MKKYFVLPIIASGIFACSSGSSNPTPPPQTTYNFSSLSFHNNSTTCSGPTTTTSAIVFTCSAAVSLLNVGVTFGSSPASYIVIPTNLPANTTLVPSGTTCGNTPVASYNCTFNITATNATSGSSIALPVNGSLGQQNFIVVNFQ